MLLDCPALSREQGTSGSPCPPSGKAPPVTSLRSTAHIARPAADETHSCTLAGGHELHEDVLEGDS